MYIHKSEGLGLDQATTQPCDKIEFATLRVPFHPNVDEFLKNVCCAIGRWMIFRTDQPPGRQAWCFVKKNETFLKSIHAEMSPGSPLGWDCVDLQARYCRRGGATIDVTITKRTLLRTKCPTGWTGSSLCKPGVCNPSVVCPPTTQHRPHPPPKPEPPVMPPPGFCREKCLREIASCPGGRRNSDCRQKFRECMRNCEGVLV